MQECLSVAAWFGMEYPHEWLKQYLHGAQPEEVQNAAGPVQMPKHWKQQRMPSQGWRLETVSGDVLQRLQQESKMNFSPFRLLAGKMTFKLKKSNISKHNAKNYYFERRHCRCLVEGGIPQKGTSKTNLTCVPTLVPT